MGKRTILLVLVIFILLMAGTGCAVKKVEPKYTIWPPATPEPKIVYLATYYGREDIRSETFVDKILGKATAFDFVKPYGVYADQDRIYITETNNPSLVILDTKKGKADFVSGGDFGAFGTPIGVAVAPDGTIYVSDAKLGGVYLFDKDGGYTATLGKRGAFKRPTGLALDAKMRRLYISDAGADAVQAYSLGGNYLFTIGASGAGPGQFHSPTNIAVDRRNARIAVVDTLNTRVQVFDSDGKFILNFGQLGDIPGQFTRPKGIGIDSDGNMHVADAAFDNVQIFSPKGEIMGYYGSAGLEPGFYFSLPTGIYIDENDRIFITDQLNSRVQVFQYLSEAWKKEHPKELEEYRKRHEEEEKKLTAPAGKDKAK